MPSYSKKGRSLEKNIYIKKTDSKTKMIFPFNVFHAFFQTKRYFYYTFSLETRNRNLYEFSVKGEKISANGKERDFFSLLTPPFVCEIRKSLLNAARLPLLCSLHGVMRNNDFKVEDKHYWNFSLVQWNKKKLLFFLSGILSNGFIYLFFTTSLKWKELNF